MGDDKDKVIQDYEHELILHEFDYIAQTAYQAQEDRVQVLAQYLTFGAALVAAVFALTEGNGDPQSWLVGGLGGIFILLSVIGYNSVKHLARLRGAWVRSAHAMNTIKESYIRQNAKRLGLCDECDENCENCRHTEFSQFFAWRENSVPFVRKPSVASLISWNIILISLASLSVGMVLLIIALPIEAMDKTNTVQYVLMIIALGFGIPMAYRVLRSHAWENTLDPVANDHPEKNNKSTET